jgi:hypothetical protein
MALPSITSKVAGSDTYNERKILADDVNQIREAIQTGAKDIKPNTVQMVGNTITADNGSNWIRRSGNTFQYHNGSAWVEPATANLLTFTAGENIAARDVVYLKVSDGKIYKASTTNNDWIGVATAAITSGASGTIYPNGSLVGGFSGLTSGTWYKVNASAGTIDASDLSINNTQYNVGVAVSATQIILIKNQLNGITNEVNRKGVIHRKVYSSAAEISRTDADWGDTNKTFNLSAPVNSLVLAVNVILQMKVNSSYGNVGLKINGTNFGTKYAMSYKKSFHTTQTANTVGECYLFTTEPSSGNQSECPTRTSETSYTSTSFNGFSILKPFKILDASTTFTLRAHRDATSITLKNVEIEVIYVENFEEDA